MAARLLILCTLLLLAMGCGYSQYNRPQRPADSAGSPLPRHDVRSIAVPTFQNASKASGAEVTITQAVRDAIVTSSVYKLHEMQQADSALEGRIVAVEYARHTGTTRESEPQYSKIELEFRWRDLWTEKPLMDWTTVRATSPEGIGEAVLASIGISPVQVAARDGYTWHSLYRQDVRTVAVPIFTNRSYTRGIEFQLTKAISNYIESATPYKVVSREHADTILEGEIVSVEGNVLSSDRRTDLPQEQMITIRVNFLWKDLRSGKILVERKAFDQSTMYYPTLGEGLYVGKQAAVERLAVGIVQEMQADW